MLGFSQRPYFFSFLGFLIGVAIGIPILAILIIVWVLDLIAFLMHFLGHLIRNHLTQPTIDLIIQKFAPKKKTP